MAKKKQVNDSVPPTDKVKDQNWAVKVGRAKQAREAGARVRKGKSATFPTRRAQA
jgi:hypothetical protein